MIYAFAQQGIDRVGNTPDEAAAIIVKGIEKKSPRVLIGADAVAIDVMARSMPQMSSWRRARQACMKPSWGSRVVTKPAWA